MNNFPYSVRIKKIIKETPLVHSYIFEPTESQVILATSVYGGQKFCSAVRQGNIYGCQFHPEKSGEAGVTIIRHFVNLQNG